MHPSFVAEEEKKRVINLSLVRPLRRHAHVFTCGVVNNLILRATAAAPLLRHRRDILFLSCLFRRLTRRPHKNVLSAWAIDDGGPSMPILMPRADCDLETYLNRDMLPVRDRLR